MLRWHWLYLELLKFVRMQLHDEAHTATRMGIWMVKYIGAYSFLLH
jgi:hypothetical protein